MHFININCEGREHGIEPAPAKCYAPDRINVNAAVSRMGNHLINARAPERGDPL